MNWSTYLNNSVQQRHRLQAVSALNAEKIKFLKENPLTKRISYQELSPPFDYVHNLYPEANVKQAFVYHAKSHSLLEAGYGGVGGFYDIESRIIFVTDFIYVDSDVKAEFTIDEVVCHELIHYAANYKMRCSSRKVEEEIAYGKSINYLRSKGRTDDFIIEKNMLPYLLSIVNREEIYREVLLDRYGDKLLSGLSEKAFNILLKDETHNIKSKMKIEAIKIGKNILDKYDNKLEMPFELNNYKQIHIDGDL